MRWPFVLLASAGAGACGLSVTGQLVAEDGTTPSADASAVDAAAPSDAGEGDATLDLDAASLCDSGLSVGAVILPPDGGACPAGTTEKTVQIDPVAGDGACSCGTCTPTSDPSCAGATKLGVSWGSSNACGSGSDSYTITDNACIDWGYGTFSLVAYHGWSARTPTAGSCSAAAVTDPTKVTTTSFRECVPNDASAICSAQASGAKLCVDSGGSACAGAFSKSVVVGDAADVACAACSCSRTSAKCVVEYHGDGACTSLKYTTEANGVCTRTNDASNVNHLKVYPATPTCTATPGAATPSLKNPKTLCCMP